MNEIIKKRRYSLAEFASIVGRKPSTIHSWLRSGLIARRVHRPIPTRNPSHYFIESDIAIAFEIIRRGESRCKKSGETHRRRSAAQPIVRSILAQWVKEDRSLLESIAHTVTQTTKGKITLSIEDVAAILKREKWDVSATDFAVSGVTDKLDRSDRPKK